MQSLLPRPDQPVAQRVAVDRDAIRHPSTAPWRDGGQEQAETQYGSSGLGHHALIQL